MEQLKLVEEAGWEAKVTSDLDDILMCGTDVPGSCQNVHGKGSLNQGLIGYMQDGKMAGVWYGDKLFGRNMLFLGWDREQEKHVVVMAANTYGQPECDDRYREAIKLAGTAYADWLGLELVDSISSLDTPETEEGAGVRKIDIALNVPTYFDGRGVCSNDIVLTVRRYQ